MNGYYKRLSLPAAILSVLVLISSCAPARKLTVYTNASPPPFIVKHPETWVNLPHAPNEVLSVARGTSGRKRLPAMSVTVSPVAEGFKLETIPEITLARLRAVWVGINPKSERFRIKESRMITLNDGSRALKTNYTWGWYARKYIPFYATQVSTIKDNKLVTAFATGSPFFCPLQSLHGYTDSLRFSPPGTAVAARAEEMKDIKTVTEKRAPESTNLIGLPFSSMSADDLGEIETAVVEAQEKLVAETLTRDGNVKTKWSLFGKKINIQLSEASEDVEAIEMYEPENNSSLPDTGFVVQNDTDRIVIMKISGDIEKSLVTSAGNLGAEALPVGNYSYSFFTPEDGALEHLSGKRVVKRKYRYYYRLYAK